MASVLVQGKKTSVPAQADKELRTHLSSSIQGMLTSKLPCGYRTIDSSRTSIQQVFWVIGWHRVCWVAGASLVLQYPAGPTAALVTSYLRRHCHSSAEVAGHPESSGAVICVPGSRQEHQ
ncbi:uncharacterized protein WM277_017259 [Molossus nigricans]